MLLVTVQPPPQRLKMVPRGPKKNGLTRKVKTKVVQPVTAVYAVQLDQEKVSGRTTQSLPVIIHIVLIYK